MVFLLQNCIKKNKNLFRLNTFHCKFFVVGGAKKKKLMNSVYNVIIITRTTIESGYIIIHNITLAYRIAKKYQAPLTNVNLNGVVTSRVCRYIYHIYFVCRSAYLTQIYLFIYSKKMKILCTGVHKLMQIFILVLLLIFLLLIYLILFFFLLFLKY